jgi:AcrR family transcriptional regulator
VSAASSLRSRRRAQVVEDLRRTALALFARRGFDAVTPEEIAAAAGVSRSTYFRHTPSKESLLVDALLEGIAGMVGVLGARPPGEAPTTAAGSSTSPPGASASTPAPTPGPRCWSA